MTPEELKDVKMPDGMNAETLSHLMQPRNYETDEKMDKLKLSTCKTSSI